LSGCRRSVAGNWHLKLGPLGLITNNTFASPLFSTFTIKISISSAMHDGLNGGCTFLYE